MCFRLLVDTRLASKSGQVTQPNLVQLNVTLSKDGDSPVTGPYASPAPAPWESTPRKHSPVREGVLNSILLACCRGNAARISAPSCAKHRPKPSGIPRFLSVSSALVPASLARTSRLHRRADPTELRGHQHIDSSPGAGRVKAREQRSHFR